MINRDDNPEYLNSFLDYSITILNKSPNSIKEYNYDLAMFLKYIKIHHLHINNQELCFFNFISWILLSITK